MTVFHSIISKISSNRLKEIDLFRQHPGEVQAKVLQELLSTAKDTEWGRKYSFKDITDIRDFQAKLPISAYEELKTDIERSMRGEKNILWPGITQWYAKSSGTSCDKSKFIPITQDSLKKCHYKAGLDVLWVYANNYPETGIVHGKNLCLGGSHQISNFNNKSFTGDLSAIILEKLPILTQLKNVPRPSISLIPDFEEKIAKVAEATINENIRSFSGVPSWFLVLINHILEVTGKSNLLEVWPNLEVFIHGGVHFEPYREQYKRLIPSEKMNYMETYNASEGFFSLQDEPGKDDMLLMLDLGIFMEFIPMSEFGKENPMILSIEEIELDTNYALVISTNTGLWRYILGDTIKFTCKYPHKIKITGRTKHFINAFGEEVIVDNAEKALQSACRATSASISDYTAGPVYMNAKSKGAHQWLIEFENKPENLEVFSLELDKALKSLNSDYEAKRHKNLALEPPLIISMQKGTFYQWMKERGKVGGQNKIPRLSNNRKYLDQLLKVNERLSHKK